MANVGLSLGTKTATDPLPRGDSGTGTALSYNGVSLLCHDHGGGESLSPKRRTLCLAMTTEPESLSQKRSPCLAVMAIPLPGGDSNDGDGGVPRHNSPTNKKSFQ
jgi:hypothetical protein